MAQSEVIVRLERIDERLAGWEEERDRSLRENTELRTFLDELLRRHASITQDWIGALAGLQAEIADQREAFQREMTDQREAFKQGMADQRGQLHANTQAVLRLLDERFGPEPPQG